MRDIVKQDRAGATLGAVAPQLRSREPELVPQRPSQGLLLHHVNPAKLPVHIQANEPFAGAANPVDNRVAKQIAR